MGEVASGMSLGGGAIGDGLVEAGELFEGPGPAVAFVGGEGLEEGDGGVVGGAVEVAEVGWDMGEVGDVGEEARNFDVGIDAGGEAAEEFEDGRFAVEDAGVGLLDEANAGGEVGEGGGVDGVGVTCDEVRGCRAAGLSTALRSGRDDGAAGLSTALRSGRDDGGCCDHAEKGGAEGRVGGRVEEDHGLLALVESGDDGVGGGGFEGGGLGFRHEGQRELVEVGGAVLEDDLDEGDDGVGVADLGGGDDLSELDGFGFATEPALADDVCGKERLDTS